MKTYEDMRSELFVDGMAIRDYPAEYRDNKEIARLAVQSDGRALCYVSERLKDDEELVLIAMDNYPKAYEDASIRLRRNLKFTLMAVNADRENLLYAPDPVLRTLPAEAILHAHGGTLEYMSDEIKDNEDLVAIAISNCPDAFQFASDRIRNNPGLVKQIDQDSLNSKIEDAINAVIDIQDQTDQKTQRTHNDIER